jgi:hypothetical protein
VNNMATHVKVLGALYIALGSVGVLFALILAIGIGGAAHIVGASAPPEDAAIALPIIGIAGTALVVLVMALSLPALATGIGLLYVKPWARVLGIVLGAISLLGFPWGTILGIYALWVLLSSATEPVFEREAATPPPQP